MTMTITLTLDELIALTGYRRGAEQLAELRHQGFWRARRSISGAVVLERAHYDAVCRGQDAAPKQQHRPQLRAA